LGYADGSFPHSEALSQEILSLPLYPGLSDRAIQQVVTSVKTLLGLSSEKTQPYSNAITVQTRPTVFNHNSLDKI